jgi:hypothetical protein
MNRGKTATATCQEWDSYKEKCLLHVPGAPGNSPQLGVNEGHQAAERLFISSAPSGNQPADIPWTSTVMALPHLP